MAIKKNIFISHVHENDDLLPKLKALLARQDVEIRDGSVDSSKPNDAKNEDYIKEKILKPRIDRASVLVVLITPDTASSWWVNWEIEYAAKQGKHIIGVCARGATDADRPPALEALGDATVVGWDSESVADAILADKTPWQTPTGAEQKPVWEIQRYRC